MRFEVCKCSRKRLLRQAPYPWHRPARLELGSEASLSCQQLVCEAGDLSRVCC